MKKEDIQAGVMYGNGKGVIRKVISVSDKEVEYEIIEDGTKSKKAVGKQDRNLLGNFAKWARYESGGLVERECMKDFRWESGGEVDFVKGKRYVGELKKGDIRPGLDTFRVIGEHGKEGNFHAGSEYFDIG